MGVKVKTFTDGSFLEYDKGLFDPWCVYINDSDGRRALKDVNYLEQLRALAQRYGRDTVYEDYVRIYDKTGKEVDAAVLQDISRIVQKYWADVLSADKLLSGLYLAMISEERKENTRLGKRIKRLGVHCLLKEGRSVHDSANFMRGMGWQEISALCKARGF